MAVRGLDARSDLELRTRTRPRELVPPPPPHPVRTAAKETAARERAAAAQTRAKLAHAREQLRQRVRDEIAAESRLCRERTLAELEGQQELRRSATVDGTLSFFLRAQGRPPSRADRLGAFDERWRPMTARPLSARPATTQARPATAQARPAAAGGSRLDGWATAEVQELSEGSQVLILEHASTPAKVVARGAGHSYESPEAAEVAESPEVPEGGGTLEEHLAQLHEARKAADAGLEEIAKTRAQRERQRSRTRDLEREGGGHLNRDLFKWAQAEPQKELRPRESLFTTARPRSAAVGPRPSSAAACTARPSTAAGRKPREPREDVPRVSEPREGRGDPATKGLEAASKLGGWGLDFGSGSFLGARSGSAVDCG